MDIVPCETECRPAKLLGAVLFLAITLKCHRVGVIRSTIDLDQQPRPWVREVRSTYEQPGLVKHVVLWRRQVDTPVEQDPEEPILEQTLGLPSNRSMHVKKRPYDTYPGSASLCDALNEHVDVSNRELIGPQTCAEGTFDEPWAGRTEVDHRPDWMRERYAIQLCAIGGLEIQRFVHSNRHLVGPVPPLQRHMRDPRKSLDEFPLECSGIVRQQRVVTDREHRFEQALAGI